jgi:hypothetical protein
MAEIVDAIVLETDGSDVLTLQSCALAAKVFVHESQKLLFSSISFDVLRVEHVGFTTTMKMGHMLFRECPHLATTSLRGGTFERQKLTRNRNSVFVRFHKFTIYNIMGSFQAHRFTAHIGNHDSGYLSGPKIPICREHGSVYAIPLELKYYLSHLVDFDLLHAPRAVVREALDKDIIVPVVHGRLGIAPLVLRRENVADDEHEHHATGVADADDDPGNVVAGFVLGLIVVGLKEKEKGKETHLPHEWAGGVTDTLWNYE